MHLFKTADDRRCGIPSGFITFVGDSPGCEKTHTPGYNIERLRRIRGQYELLAIL